MALQAEIKAPPKTAAMAVWNEHEEHWQAERPAKRGGALRVADSWLLRDGTVRAWELHRERFTESCVANGASRAMLDKLCSALPAVLPQRGEWFPRLEMGEQGGADFRLRVRPSPPRWQKATVWLTDRDPRTAPRVKGPDIGSLMALRAEAQVKGAQEAVLVNARGEPIEGTGCSIAWWKDGALHLVPVSEPILNGVTRKLLRGISTRHGVDLREEPMPSEDVGKYETWLVNALIGIVPVAGWLERCDNTLIDHTRLAEWRGRLDELAQPLAATVSSTDRN